MKVDYMLKIRSVVNTIGKTYVIIWRERGVFILTPYIFCISTPILTLKATIFIICNSKPDETIHDPIQQSKVYVELEVFLISPHTLVHMKEILQEYKSIARSYMTRQTNTEKREEKNLWCQGVGSHIHENTFTLGNFWISIVNFDCK